MVPGINWLECRLPQAGTKTLSPTERWHGRRGERPGGGAVALGGVPFERGRRPSMDDSEGVVPPIGTIDG